MPIGNFEFPFRAVDNGFPESNGKADRRVVDLIVIGIVVNETPEIIGIQPKVPEEDLCQAHFVVVAFGRLDWQAEEIGRGEGLNGGGT